jgi:calcineurin-like phosphoesterase family protein
MRIKDIQFDKDKLFFTSDTHFFHSNIIKYCDRPFNNVHEMNEVIVKKWNEIVPKDGVVFHLGDVSLTAIPKVLNDLLYRLNGTKYLIIGNHEKDALGKEYIRDHWTGIYDIAEIFVEDEEITYKEQHIVMCHYPMLTWNASHRGSWQLFGHVHGGLSNKGVINHHPAQMDVGVDTNDFKPYTYQEVKEKITKQMLNKK